jgi:RNA polymerase sigma-70 factor (ECF subfamily)
MTDDPFVAHRNLLFTVAYEMLGSAADAEDVVQETWVRWADVDRAEVRDPRAYLVRIVTRQALNRLRTLSRQREEYVGEWLPEPLLTRPDVAEDVELAESVSIAMLTVLETLGPVARAVFVLREVFDTPYDEIAEAVGKKPAAVRQIASRAGPGGLPQPLAGHFGRTSGSSRRLPRMPQASWRVSSDASRPIATSRWKWRPPSSRYRQ